MNNPTVPHLETLVNERGQLLARFDSAHAELLKFCNEEDHQGVCNSMADCIRVVAAICKDEHEAWQCVSSVPGVEVLGLYAGQLDGFDDRIKIGISGDMRNRQKSINWTLAFLGFDASFEIFDSQFGRAELVRNLEKQSRHDLSDLHIKGEWFKPMGGTRAWIADAFLQIDQDLRASIRSVDVEQQILTALATTPEQHELLAPFRLISQEPASKLECQAKALSDLYWAWSSAFSKVCERRDYLRREYRESEGVNA